MKIDVKCSSVRGFRKKTFDNTIFEDNERKSSDKDEKNAELKMFSCFSNFNRSRYFEIAFQYRHFCVSVPTDIKWDYYLAKIKTTENVARSVTTGIIQLKECFHPCQQTVLKSSHVMQIHFLVL